MNFCLKALFCAFAVLSWTAGALASEVNIARLCGKTHSELSVDQRNAILDFIARNDENNSIESGVEEAYCLGAVGLYDKAVDLLRTIEGKGGTYPYLYQLKSEMELASGQYKQSINDCDHSLRSGLGDSLCYLTMGKANFYLKRYPDAESALKKGLQDLVLMQDTSMIKKSELQRFSPDEEAYYLSLAELYRVEAVYGRDSQKVLDVLMEGFERNNLSLKLFDEIVKEMRRRGMEPSGFIDRGCLGLAVQRSDFCAK
jgi:tetratricopeptide (TPR) repeat protein